MRRSTREYETALLVDGEVLVIDGIVYQGQTMLDEEGAERFAPLERWAKGVAESLGTPVTWQARAKNEPEARGSARPGQGVQNRLAL